MDFSIIVPVYNVAQYLRECLDSIVAQSCQDWECICIDDGSTDDSGAILDQYAAQDKRFVVVHQSNAGVSAARNRGMDEARGDYVLFVDGDDACVPWMLEDLSRAVELEPDADFIKFGAQTVVDLTVALPKRTTVNDNMKAIRIDSAESAREAYRRVRSVMLAWGGCHKRESIDVIRFRSYPNGEDALFAFEALLHAKRIAFCEAELYRYRLPRAGSANSMSLKNLRSCCAVSMDEYRTRLTLWKYGPAVRSIDARKNRSILYSIKYKIVQNVPSGDRLAAWHLFRDDLRNFRDKWRNGLPKWDLFVAGLASWPFVGKALFHAFGYWPFRSKVLLLKIPGVATLKTIVRKSRG